MRRAAGLSLVIVGSLTSMVALVLSVLVLTAAWGLVGLIVSLTGIGTLAAPALAGVWGIYVFWAVGFVLYMAGAALIPEDA